MAKPVSFAKLPNGFLFTFTICPKLLTFVGRFQKPA